MPLQGRISAETVPLQGQGFLILLFGSPRVRMAAAMPLQCQPWPYQCRCCTVRLLAVMPTCQAERLKKRTTPLFGGYDSIRLRLSSIESGPSSLLPEPLRVRRWCVISIAAAALSRWLITFLELSPWRRLDKTNCYASVYHKANTERRRVAGGLLLEARKALSVWDMGDKNEETCSKSYARAGCEQ